MAQLGWSWVRSTEDARLAGPLAERLIEHNIGQVQPLDGSEGAGLEAVDAGGEGLVARRRLDII